LPGSVVADGKTVRGDVAISWAADNGRTIALINGNHLTKASVGYEVRKVIEQTTGKSGEPISRTLDGRAFGRVLERCQRESPGDLAAFRRALDGAAGPLERAADAPATYRVIDWEILENSLVTVPADASVGVGRMAELPHVAPETTQTEPTKPEMKEHHPMETTTPDVAAIERAAADKSLQRIKAIEAVAKQFEHFQLGEMPQQAIRNGISSEDFAKQVMDHIAARGAQQWQPDRHDRPGNQAIQHHQGHSRHAFRTTGAMPAWSALHRLHSPTRQPRPACSARAKTASFCRLKSRSGI
jgi:hypothetical protein